MKISKLASMAVVPLFFTATGAYAAKGQTFGEHAAGHGASELGNFFSFVTIGGAFVGFVIGLVCLFGMASIKMAPNAPVSQKFETAGMGGLLVGLIIGAAMMAFGSLAYMFIGTAAGSDADTSAFDKLKSSSIEYRVVPEGHELSFVQTETIIAKV